jgi:hypothetical protein
MRPIHLFLFVSVLIIVCSCNKPIEYEAGWVGNWEVQKVDSAWLGKDKDTIVPSETIKVSGFIYFYEDSTGFIDMTNRFNCDTLDRFRWELFKGRDNQLLISYYSGPKEVLTATKMGPTELIFWKSTCTPNTAIGSYPIHQFHCQRIEAIVY